MFKVFLLFYQNSKRMKNGALDPQHIQGLNNGLQYWYTIVTDKVTFIKQTSYTPITF